MRLTYFKEEEFRGWFSRMSPVLLAKLDLFRWKWGGKVVISPADGAIGRHVDDESQHNVDKWGEVRAIDVMPEGLKSSDDMLRALSAGLELGFTGIGIYPFWQPGPGLHLDVREDRRLGDDPATWGAVLDQSGRQIYVSVAEALDAMRYSA